MIDCSKEFERVKEAGESGSRIIPILPYLISDLPEIHMHALPTAISKGVTLRHSAGLVWRPRGRDPTAMPPSIAIATPVLGGPGTMRVVLNSSSSLEKVI